MSDTSNFGFGKLVPGFDFLQSLAKGASGGIPQLPSLSNWVAPTLSVEELEKRIDELKAVQFWLEQNSRALAATVQALEVQKMTLATLKGMNFSMGDLASAFQPKGGDSVMDGVQKAASSMAGAAEAMVHAATRGAGRAGGGEAGPAEPPAAPESPPPSASPTPGKGATRSEGPGSPQAAGGAAPTVVDPMQWWGALTSQFQQIAASALKDPAHQTAIETTKSMATGAFKAASDMASQLAAQGMETLQGAGAAAAPSRAPRAPRAASAAAKKPAPARKAPAPRAARSATRSAARAPSPAAAKKSSTRSTPRKPAR